MNKEHKIISIRLNDDTLEKIDDVCKQELYTRSVFIRRAIQYCLAENEEMLEE